MEVSLKRSDQLIANFIDGYAEGWFMKVPECFKRELDIQLTPRIVPDIWGLYILPAKKSLTALSSPMADFALSIIKQIEENTNRIVVWGNKKSSDSFDQLVTQTVDLIKKTKDKDAIASIARKKTQIWTQGIRYCFGNDYIIHSNDNIYSIQILSAIPSEIEISKNSPLTKRINHGFVKFAIYRLVNDKTEKLGEQTLNQNEFVQFLKYGNSALNQKQKSIGSITSQQAAFDW